MLPKKLEKGDEVRVISPSMSMGIISDSVKNVAISRFSDMGLKISFGKHAFEMDEFESSNIRARIDDIHEAFMDSNVNAVIASIGGFNSNQLLHYIDYELIKSNPKIICGYSDITALISAIYKKTGIITYHGPSFSAFGMLKGFDYTIEYFRKCLMSKNSFNISSSEEWSDDKWYEDQKNRTFIKNTGPLIINEGSAKGKLIGGNLCTFNLLHGTEYMPKLKGAIIFIEDDDITDINLFNRDLQSLIHQPGFDDIQGIIIGRFQKKSNITNDKIIKMIHKRKELLKIAIVANMDFGHTFPMFTLPIGGIGKLEAINGSIHFEIIQH